MPYYFQDLSDNKLGNGCAAFISQIMHQNVTLTHITISGKSIVIERKTSNLSKLEINCILMDFPIQIKSIRMGLSIVYFKGLQVSIFQL